jgi:epoxyqueuosine reductase QueG
MSDLTAEFAQYARERRADLLGVASIERFDGVPAAHHPAAIFPECRNVVVVGKRIPRGALRGIEEGTQFDLYGQYGLFWLKDRMLAITTIALATWLEDQGWEACPVQDLPPEVPPSGVAVSDAVPPPNVMIDVAHAAVRAGLGEIGWCGELLTPGFGPRQRCQLILTDAPLDATPLLDEPVCDHCRACEHDCPLGAFTGEARSLTLAGKTMQVAAIDPAVCRSCQNGACPNPSHPSGRPDRLGALCVRSCLHHLEQDGRIANALENPFRKRPAWARDARGNVAFLDSEGGR